MKLYSIFTCLLILPVFAINSANAQSVFPDEYNVTWNSQSINSSESMPCGGGDIGLNVWVEKGDVLCYVSRSGTFDENNEFVKLGRIRIKLNPNPFEGDEFEQKLQLNDGYIQIKGKNGILEASLKVWVNVFQPEIFFDIESNHSVDAEVFYENWRYKDLPLRPGESFANSYKWAPFEDLRKPKDSVRFDNAGILFYHRNKPGTVFDVTVEQQGLDSIKNLLYNPLKNLTFGGFMWGKGMETGEVGYGKYLDTGYKFWSLKTKKPEKKHEIALCLYTEQTNDVKIWEEKLFGHVEKAFRTRHKAEQQSVSWWNEYWKKSFIIIESENTDENAIAWQVGLNYQLFRYMLGCNAYGSYPTKFNGGLFTYDPCFTDSNRCFTPDYRNWGGGTFTAQNQRLVYFPMLKSGDFEYMKPQFDFYLRILKTAELRSKVYWGHTGACFTEQLENFGLPNCSEYGWKRPDWYDKGMQYNAWLEYQWDTSLEFCLMMLEQYYYAGIDISEYINFIISNLTFFDKHYQYLAKQRGIKILDEKGHLVLYPGSGCETYKMAYNSTSTIAALKTILEKMLDLPDQYINQTIRKKLQEMLTRIPPIEFRTIEGKTTIASAKLWERVNNTESPQLYPVFPWGIYGVGKPGLDTAINTYKFDPDALKFRNYIGWKQDNIWAARLGLTNEAWKYTSLKLKDSGRRFPAFWGPGFDWVPDHNWGGSGMIGLQEMLLQTAGDKIYLFPAWPKDIDVHFKLYAPQNTVIEAKCIHGKTEVIQVWPEKRKLDIVIN